MFNLSLLLLTPKPFHHPLLPLFIVLIDQAETIEAFASDIEKGEAEDEITTEDLDEMESVLEEIAKERKINIEQDALRGLKDEVSEYKEV